MEPPGGANDQHRSAERRQFHGLLSPPNRGCPPAESGWQLQIFQENFEDGLQDALDAGFTVGELLTMFGVSSLDQLYQEIVLPGYLWVDRTTGDGLICAKEPIGVERQGPWLSSIIDNVMAT